ncbi:MAG TPA: hypothetical protein VHC50_09160 [Puia sp.]|nr:hypothetical protein [Puia sp.]
MIIKFKSLESGDRSLALIKLALCFLGGVLAALLLFELLAR